MTSIDAELSTIATAQVDTRVARYLDVVRRLCADADVAVAVAGLKRVITHAVDVEGRDQSGRTYVTPKLLTTLSVSVLDAALARLMAEADDDDDVDMSGTATTATATTAGDVADTPPPITSTLDVDALVDVAAHLVTTLHRVADHFPNELMRACWTLAEVREAQDELLAAAEVLASFRFDAHRNVVASAVDIVRWCVKTTELFLDCGESAQASVHIKRAHAHANDGAVRADPALSRQFQLMYARTLDHDRRFLEAAVRFHDLSQPQAGSGAGAVVDSSSTFAAAATTETAALSPQEQEERALLTAAVTCGILAKAGQPRARVLAQLCKDERAASLPVHFPLLECMSKGRIVRQPQVAEFEATLAPHQNAQTASGRTVLGDAVTEHNLLTCGAVYENVRVAALGAFLNTTPREAERLAATMIQQGRLRGAVIDQVHGVVDFSACDVGAGGGPGGAAADDGNSGGGGGGVGSMDRFGTVVVTGEQRRLRDWDTQIERACVGVNEVLDEITLRHPAYEETMHALS